MALEIKLQQKQIQSLVMTPQLQQAIKLLQLGHQDYVEVITNELLENPTLEEDGGEDFKSSNLNEPEERNIDNKDHSEYSFRDSVDDEGGTIRRENKTEEFEFNGLYYENTRKGNAPEDSVSALEGSISAPQGLSSHLLWQLQTLDLTQEMRQIAVHIVCNLDSNGFLAIPVSEIAEECLVSEDIIE
jgi:RNA polymerase sigma-54 factor